MINKPPPSSRLAILTTDEVDALYARPVFTLEDQIEYFELTPPEEASLSQLSKPTSQLYFILQLGYFKARHRFFQFSLAEVVGDLNYIRTRYFGDLSVEPEDLSRVTTDRQRDMILELTDYRRCGETERDQLRDKAQQLARIDSQPIYILRELFAYLAHQRWIAPGYSWFQELIGGVLASEQARLIAVVTQQMTDTGRDALKVLFE